MNFVKKYLKTIIGIAVLVLAIAVFFFMMRYGNIENGTLRKWRTADHERRMAAAQILSASDDNLDLLVQCVDKIATLPESGDMMVRDAVTLCNMGIIMNKNN